MPDISHSIVRRSNVMVFPNASHRPKTARGQDNHQIVTLRYQIYEFFDSTLIRHPRRVSLIRLKTVISMSSSCPVGHFYYLKAQYLEDTGSNPRLTGIIKFCSHSQIHALIDLLVRQAIVLWQGVQHAAAARRHTSVSGGRGAGVSA